MREGDQVEVGHNGFFEFHGFWAPGVRLFRQIGFRYKALIVSACFMLPMAVLAAAWFGQFLESREFSHKEVRGVAYAREAMPALEQALRERSGGQTPDGAAWTAVLARLDAVQQASADEFGSAAALTSLRQTVETAAKGGGWRAQDAVARAAVALVVQVTDGSNLTLDPDLDTYYLMDGALMRIPQYLEDAGRLAVLIRVDADTPEILRGKAYVELLHAQLGAAAAKVEGVHPGTGAAFALDEVDARRKALFQAVEGGADAATVAGASSALAEALLATQKRMLADLDTLLHARLDRADTRATALASALVVGLLLAGYFFASFYRVMHGGLNETRRHLEAMTRGDLTTHPTPGATTRRRI